MKRILNARNALIFTILIFAILFITQAEPYVRSDSWCYYTISKNLIENQNFVSSQKPEYWDYMEHLKEKKDDKYISVCSSGTAFIHLPGLFISNIFEGEKTTYNDYFKSYNGHTIYDGIAILLTATTVGFLSIILIYKILRKLGYSEKLSIIGTFISFGSSFAIWYIFLLPMFTHIYEVFCVSLILFIFLKFKTESNKKLAYVLGALSGISILVRPTLVPIVLVLFLFLVFKKDLSSIVKFILGGLPFGIIWCIYNFISYGSFFTSGYSSVRSENFDFSKFNGLNILFSQYRGLFIYSPIFVFSVIGLILLFKKQKSVSILSLVGILSAVIIYGFWPAWWGGGSFGSRFMIFAVPFFAVGITEFIRFVKTRVKFKSFKLSVYFLICIFFIYSLGLTFLYRVTITSNLAKSYEGRVDGMYSADRYTPFLIYKFHFDLLKNSDSIKSYAKDLYENVNGGSGLLAIPLGITNAVLRIDDRDSSTKFIILNPPKMRRDLPDEIEGYYISNSKIDSFRFSNLEGSEVFSFECQNNCSSSTIVFEASKLEKVSLPTQDYSCFVVQNENFICFKNAPNLQFRGFPLDIEVGQDSYNFQINF